jgi:Protein of unknown function (DUF2931)
MEEKFEWSGTVSAPQEYPMEIFRGCVKSEEASFEFNSMWGTTNGGWGNAGKLMSANYCTVPNYVEITWLSIVEKKFYSGQGHLPIKMMTDLFKEGYLYNGVKETFSKITIGLAPKGVFVVWLAGENQVEIAKFQAQEILIDKDTIRENEVYMFKEDFTETVLQDSMTMTREIRHKINIDGYCAPQMYEAYREKYLWKPKLVLPENTTLISLYIKMCNGEKEYCENDKLYFTNSRAVPYNIEVIWKDDKDEEYVSRIALTNDQKYWNSYLKEGKSALPLDFEKNEIISIFKNLDNNKVAELVIKIDDTQERDNQWVTHFYLDQLGHQYLIKEISQDSGKY